MRRGRVGPGASPQSTRLSRRRRGSLRYALTGNTRSCACVARCFGRCGRFGGFGRREEGAEHHSPLHLSSASDGRPRKLLDRLAPVTRGPCGGCWLVGRFIFKVILLSRLRERERGSVRPFALYTSSDVSTPLRPSKQHCLDVSYVHFTSLYTPRPFSPLCHTLKGSVQRRRPA